MHVCINIPQISLALSILYLGHSNAYELSKRVWKKMLKYSACVSKLKLCQKQAVQWSTL